MRLRQKLAILSLLAALAAGPAEACISGGTQYLFDQVPDNAPAGTSVMLVEFTNQGAEFSEWQARAPERAGERRLVGIARRIDGFSGGAFPVYVLVTSCAHEFYGEPPALWERRAYLVGRFERLNGIEVFIARGRRWSVRPGEFEAD
jgi:hypothetical protein